MNKCWCILDGFKEHALLWRGKLSLIINIHILTEIFAKCITISMHAWRHKKTGFTDYSCIIRDGEQIKSANVKQYACGDVCN